MKINQNIFKNNMIIIILSVLSLAYFFKLLILSNGYMINQYPFISPDGFDWITEGLYLSEAIKGNVFDGVLPVARPPFFVFITAIDAFFGQTGIVIWLVNSIAFFVTGYIGLLLIGYKNRTNWFNAIFIIALLLAPINYVRIWMLSDGITVALSLLTVYYLQKYQNYNFKQITVGALLIAISGSSQIYGLMIPLIYLGIFFLFAVKNKQFSIIKQILFITTLALIFYAIVNYAWFQFIPHDMTPKNFVLLQLSLDMFWFYFHTWGFYFFPFIPLFLLIRLLTKEEYVRDILLLSLWVGVIIFMTLCFVYQWQESRFTFMFWSILVIAIFRSSIYLKQQQEIFRIQIYTIVSFLIIFQSFLISIPNEWRPDLKNVSISPATWIGTFVVAKPIDRFELKNQCGSVHSFCSDAIVHGDGYVQSVINIYKKLSFQYENVNNSIKPKE